MCNVALLEHFIDNVNLEEFENKRVLEVGSKYVNGSVRPLIEKFFSPEEYIGVDVEPGKYVDLILPAERVLEYFGPGTFDVVIATELLEHIMNWRLVTRNMKEVLKHGGYIYITTRSKGFHYHAYPYDFWRYEIEDMKGIFADFKIIVLEKDHEASGVFLKARKMENHVSANLSDIALYSMVLGRRSRSIPNLKDVPFTRRLWLKLLSSKIIWLLPGICTRNNDR